MIAEKTKAKYISNARATRYSKPEHHAKYGIYNYLSGKGFTNEERMAEICQQYCDENGFAEREDKDYSRLGFIQNNFGKFGHYVNKIMKTELGKSYFTSKPIKCLKP